MNCTECENYIEDYNGKPYCFIGQFSLDGISMQRGSPCVDFEPKEEDDNPICTKASPASRGIYKKAEEGET